MVREAADCEASDEPCAGVYAACGGNRLQATELLRAAEWEGRPLAARDPGEQVAVGLGGWIARRVVASAGVLALRRLPWPRCSPWRGDDCQLRHVAAIAGVQAESTGRGCSTCPCPGVRRGHGPDRKSGPWSTLSVETTSCRL